MIPAIRAAIKMIHRTYDISWLYEHAGFVSIATRNSEPHITVHIFPSYSHWSWGYDEGWHDGPLFYFGFGPLFLVVGDGI